MSESENMQAIDLFSGLGGVTSAIASCYDKSVSVERDPKNDGVSMMYAVAHRQNFSERHKFVYQTVQDWVEGGFEGVEGKVDLLHGSPSCRHYTAGTRSMKIRPVEDEADLTCAIAYNDSIKNLSPTIFTMEQVPDYHNSEAFCLAMRDLDDSYHIAIHKINLADYGLPQNRKRLFVVAWKKGTKAIALPKKVPHKGWYSVMEGLTAKETNYPVAAQDWTIREPLLLRPTKGVTMENAILWTDPAPTILRSHFIDDKDNARRTTFKYLHNGKCCVMPIRAIARLQGFPETFRLPSHAVVAGTGIGNAFPSSFYKSFLQANNLCR